MAANEVLANQTVVIDNGSGSIKGGIAGTTKPSLIIPTYEGRPKHPPCDALTLENEIFSGHRAAEKRGLLRLSYPMKQGIIQDWDAMERLWSVLYSELKVKPDDHSVLLTEAALNPLENRRRMMEVFFDNFNVPAFFVSMQAVLALYASARTSGVVLDVGEGVAQTVPVMEGFALTHSIRRADVAGRDVTEHLATLLRRAGKIFHTSAELEIVRSIKETACFVSYAAPKDEHYKEAYTTADKTSTATRTENKYQYELPDKTSITLGPERAYAPEILFNPSIIGLEYPGVHQLLSASISRTDMDLRKELTSQIVLSGGSTLFTGFVDRVMNELRKLQPKESLIKVFAPPERHLATFAGGSILSSLPSFQQLWVPRTAYEEEGPTALFRRAF